MTRELWEKKQKVYVVEILKIDKSQNLEKEKKIEFTFSLWRAQSLMVQSGLWEFVNNRESISSEWSDPEKISSSGYKIKTRRDIIIIINIIQYHIC